jgi:hypothetical protein
MTRLHEIHEGAGQDCLHEKVPVNERLHSVMKTESADGGIKSDFWHFCNMEVGTFESRMYQAWVQEHKQEYQEYQEYGTLPC